ncbi:MAG: penicillin-binding protein 1C [Bacteroidales bacterium]|nr:penicillin-binding protein 1C [Bacteroidales bacterium]
MLHFTKKILPHYNAKWFYLFLFLFFAVTICFWFWLPSPLFSDPTCTVITDEQSNLLDATIACDGQYRFPETNSIPPKFAKCIVTFEDRHFYQHPGVNPFSVWRALVQNIKAKKIVRGGSTISMQVIRLSRKGQSRSFSEKIVEIVLALRLELSYSKNKILRLYASHAPYGGNVVGIDAAAWRYFGRSANELSWAETASLAILPNAPSIIFPGKNQVAFKNKRNRLLKKLLNAGEIDSLTYSLSIQEPLPGEPKELPQLAPHLLTRAIIEGYSGKNVKTTINSNLQSRINNIVEYHKPRLEANSIHNIAVLVLDIETGNTLAYIGNTNPDSTATGKSVDVIKSPRSTGSILKPFLYAAMLNDGLILPNTLIPDIPTQIGSYAPKNFYPTYDGAVPASRALARSLNVPAVRMLQMYGVPKFHHVLNKMGLTTIKRSPDSYGLSLVLGGAEATLWDLAGVYSSLARMLNHFRPLQSRYNKLDIHPPTYISDTTRKTPIIDDHSILGAASIFLTFEAMREVARPDELSGWKYFASTRSVAWKTGTSYGHRDAWAIGLNPNQVVAVWVGNASGEGRADLTGVSAAAPIMFDVFGLLPPSGWFERPIDDMAFIPVCKQSGQRATDICEPIDSVWVPIAGLETPPCPYHRMIHLDEKGKYRVNDKCYDRDKMQHQSWFVLPPAMEWFYKSKKPDYRVLPSYLQGCKPENPQKPMAMLYPRIINAIISIPVNLDGTPSDIIFEAVHRTADATIYWHLDDKYVGTTKAFHKLALRPSTGKHVLTLVDGDGETLVTTFTIDKSINN